MHVTVAIYLRILLFLGSVFDNDCDSGSVVWCFTPSSDRWILLWIPQAAVQLPSPYQSNPKASPRPDGVHEPNCEVSSRQ